MESGAAAEKRIVYDGYYLGLLLRLLFSYYLAASLTARSSDKAFVFYLDPCAVKYTFQLVKFADLPRLDSLIIYKRKMFFLSPKTKVTVLHFLSPFLHLMFTRLIMLIGFMYGSSV